MEVGKTQCQRCGALASRRGYSNNIYPHRDREGSPCSCKHGEPDGRRRVAEGKKLPRIVRLLAPEGNSDEVNAPRISAALSVQDVPSVIVEVGREGPAKGQVAFSLDIKHLGDKVEVSVVSASGRNLFLPTRWYLDNN